MGCLAPVVALFAPVAIVMIGGCGPSTKPPATTGGGGATTGDPATFTRAEPTPEAICGRIFELKGMSCEITSSYDLSRDECLDDFGRSLGSRGEDARTANLALGRCLIDNASCDAVDACVDGLHTAAEGFRQCGNGGIEPVGMPRAEWDRRKSATITRYSQASSTKEEPIEVCGIWEPGGQVDWLLNLTCEDGSHPFRGQQHAHASRVGNVGAGGRCGSIVDLYEVPCPEGTYAIYIDAYVCPLPD